LARNVYFEFNSAINWGESVAVTIELTWGETATTQVYMKEEPPNKSSCFALTSNDGF